MTKILSMVFLFFNSISAYAASGDGIYSCTANMLGRSYPAYITVNSHIDGSAVYTVAAISPSQEFFGYGIGYLTSTKFTGTTQYGAPFDFNINPNTYSVSGTISVLLSGSFVKASVACGKIW